MLHDLIQYESVSSNCSNVRGSKKENLYIIKIYIDLVYCNSHLSSILLQTQIKIHTDSTREDHLGAGRPEGKDTRETYGTVLALSTATNLSPWRERTPKTIADRTLPNFFFFFSQLHNSSSIESKVSKLDHLSPLYCIMQALSQSVMMSPSHRQTVLSSVIPSP